MNISVLLERIETNTDEQNCESFNDSYKKLAMLIGVDAVIKLYTAYGGGYISLPKKLFDDKYIQQLVYLSDLSNGFFALLENRTAVRTGLYPRGSRPRTAKRQRAYQGECKQ